MIRNFKGYGGGDVDLTPFNKSLSSLSNEFNNFKTLINLTTFTRTEQVMTAGLSFFKMEDWLTSESNMIEIFGIRKNVTNTLGFWHTIDDSFNLLTTSDIINQTTITEYKKDGKMNKSNATSLEGYVIDSLTNIGMYPWTGTDYDQYVFKYGIPYSNLSWNVPTLPEKINSITYSFIYSITNQGHNPTISFNNLNDMDYFNFNNTEASLTGTYSLIFNNQQLRTFDLINGAIQFDVYSFKADEVNYSAPSGGGISLDGVVSPVVNIKTPCILCAFSSCELNDVIGHSEASANIINPVISSDLNIYNFRILSIFSMISSQTQKNINLDGISLASLRSIACKDFNIDNVKTLNFISVSSYSSIIDIDNIKLNNLTSAIFDLNKAVGKINHGEFKNIDDLTLSLPSLATLFTDGALLKNINLVYVEDGICSNFSIDNVNKFKIYNGRISNDIGKGEDLAISSFTGETATINNFTFNNLNYISLNSATISGGGLTAQTLKGLTVLIKDIENVSIDSLYSCTSLTFDGIKNLTVNHANAASFKDVSVADFGNGACNVVRLSNVLSCDSPFSYCDSVYIDTTHSSLLSNYVLSWSASYTI